MSKALSTKKYLLGLVILILLSAIFLSDSKKIFAVIDGQPNCSMWETSEIYEDGDMQLVNYTDGGSNINHVVVPNAADFKKFNPTKYENLKKVYIDNRALQPAVNAANNRIGGGSFVISKTTSDSSNPDEEKVFAGEIIIDSKDSDGKTTKHIGFVDTFGMQVFRKKSYIKSIDLSHWDIEYYGSDSFSLCTMFKSCTSLESVDLSNWNMENQTNTEYMFQDCTSLKHVNLSNWTNMDKIKKTDGMFWSCRSLEELDLSSLNMSAVTDISTMFGDCVSLANLNLNNWDTSNVEDMRHLFYGCTNLKNLEINDFNLGAVRNINSMFKNTPKLRFLNLNNWNINLGIGVTELFAGDNPLLIKTNDTILKNYNYAADGRTLFTTTLKVDGNLAKFKGNDESEYVKYNTDKTEKKINIYTNFTTTDTEEQILKKLRERLAAEKNNLIFDGGTAIDWTPAGDYGSDIASNLGGTYTIGTKKFLVEGTNFNWPEIKTDLYWGTEISISEFFSKAPTLPGGCTLKYKIGDEESWREYKTNSKDPIVFPARGDYKVYLQIPETDRYFSIEYNKDGKNYMIASVGVKKYPVTLKVDGQIAKFKTDEGENISYNADRTEKYIKLVSESTQANTDTKETIIKKLKERLAAEKSKIEVAKDYGVAGWTPRIDETKDISALLGTYVCTTKKYLNEGVNFEWPQLKSDLRTNEAITVQKLFSIKTVPSIPDGCKLIYKIGDGEYSYWREYMPEDAIVFDEATNYKIYLKIDGMNEYFDKEYARNGRNYMIAKVLDPEGKNNKDNDEADGTGMFYWSTISDSSYEGKTIKSISLPDTLKTGKYLEGDSNNKIRPDDNMTRGEFANVLYKLLYDDKEKINLDLLKNSDVKADNWAGKSVAYLLGKKLITLEDNKFRPNDNITRGEVVKMIYDLIAFFDPSKTKEYGYGKHYYNFMDLSGHKYAEVIRQLASHGIVSGYDDKTFGPDKNITRAEVTKIIFTAFERKSESGKKVYKDLSREHWAYKYIMDASK